MNSTGKGKTKHFLDTSLLRPLLLGSSAYRKYLTSKLNEESLYLSNYVKMEFKRSYVSNLIDFYFVLRLPNIKNINDALAFWSNKFKSSELKAIITLVSQLWGTQNLDFTQYSDKQNALITVGIYIKRIIIVLNKRFKNCGSDSTRCERNAIPFEIKSTKMSEDLKFFVEQFDDVDYCRSKCTIDKFILKRWRSEIETLISSAESLPNNNLTRGFKKISENLDIIVKEGESKCSCKMCERIGDAVIALDTPRYMQIEHTDNSFDYLCPPLNQVHRKHISEIKYIEEKNKHVALTTLIQ